MALLPRPRYGREDERMAVRDDCRHYSLRSIATGDKVERCRLDVNEKAPFACPEGCLFFEPRPGMRTGWTLPESDR
jgi:hypothetical protein